MKIVIDVPKQWEKCNIRFLKECIRNGTPLPKGHGRLIDADKLFESLKKYRYSDGFCTEHNIDYSINLGMAGILIGDAPTIIEADKEGSEEE